MVQSYAVTEQFHLSFMLYYRPPPLESRRSLLDFAVMLYIVILANTYTLILDFNTLNFLKWKH